MTSLPQFVLGLTLPAFALLGCSDSTEPAPTVPRQLYYVAYDGAPSYGVVLYGAALDGSLPKPVIEDTVPGGWRITGDFAPWISRDGSQIKVLVGKWPEGSAIATVDPFGEVLSLVPYPDSAAHYSDRRPSLSPDGTRLAWFAKGYLNLAAVDGSGIQQIYFDSLASFDGGTVGWSRDGKSLAYATWHYTQLSPWVPIDIRLWTRRLSDGFSRPIANLAAVAELPAWSRDGRWLTFTSAGEIHRVRTDGSGAEQVVYIDRNRPARSASWGPGDSLLAIATGTGVLLLRPDGTGARTLVYGKGNLDYATWRD